MAASRRTSLSRRWASPYRLIAALVTSARMRGVLHDARTYPHAAAIGSGDHVGLVTMTFDGRVVWLPKALSHPHISPTEVDLTDLTLGEALAIVFRRPQPA
ncbi:MAG: hypothetical protein JO043_03125 [Candidatus Eremiobacteraeota bacterium]|nr:hypothetical protein [Candidatus Eremiobacteraeota bacterium]